MPLTRRRKLTVALGAVVVAVLGFAVVYMVVLEDDDLPPGPDDAPEVSPAEDVDFTATGSLVDERIEFDYVVTNRRDERVAVVDPAVFGGGTAAVFTEITEQPWRYTARRDIERDLLELRRPQASRVLETDGLLLDAGESRSGHVRVDRRVTDPPDGIELCVEVVAQNRVGETEAQDSADSGHVGLANRTTNEPIEQACTGEVPLGAG